MKSRWVLLQEEIEGRRKDREHSVQTLKTSVLQRLHRLSHGKHCSPNAVGWLQHRQVGAVTRITLKQGDGHDAWQHHAVKLCGLAHLEDEALLTFSIDVHERGPVLVSYSMSIIGRCRPPLGSQTATTRPYYARVDLDDTAKGSGLCGHALLHCHVGDDPGHNRAFAPRVPLPWLLPGDALDWLLASVHPELEPALPVTTPAEG